MQKVEIYYKLQSFLYIKECYCGNFFSAFEKYLLFYELKKNSSGTLPNLSSILFIKV